jgi:hypothetical protein
VLGVTYRTSGEYVREAESLQTFERGHNPEPQRQVGQQEAAEQHEADQKAPRVRNVDDDLAAIKQCFLRAICLAFSAKLQRRVMRTGLPKNLTNGKNPVLPESFDVPR